jgi:Major Facilitator Superfamily
MCLWSIVAASQSRMTGRASFYATRSLLGLIQGGFIPDVCLYFTYFFKGKELPNRLSWFWTADIGTGIVSALLGYGILHMGGIRGWTGWQWLFALEGALTGIVGLLSWFYLPPSPTQTKSWFRGRKGWFTEREEIILVTRVIRDDPSKGGMHNRQAITIRKFIRTVADYDMWPFYLIALVCFMPFTPPAAYLTLTLRNIGFSTFQTNLLTIPATVGNILQVYTSFDLTDISYYFGHGSVRD